MVTLSKENSRWEEFVTWLWILLPRCWYFDEVGSRGRFRQFYVWFLGNRRDIWRWKHK